MLQNPLIAQEYLGMAYNEVFQRCLKINVSAVERQGARLILTIKARLPLSYSLNYIGGQNCGVAAMSFNLS